MGSGYQIVANTLPIIAAYGEGMPPKNNWIPVDQLLLLEERLLQRQAKPEGAAAADHAVHPDLPSMGLGGQLAERKPQAG